AAFESHNVVKELSLASEEKKHILPVELEQVELTHEVKYQLAGLQRTSIDNFEVITAALAKFLPIAPIEMGRSLSTGKKRSWMKFAIPALLIALATVSYFFFFVKKQTAIGADDIKKLAILALESLSSVKDDEYFADGLTSELNGMLTQISVLRVTNRRTAME